MCSLVHPLKYSLQRIMADSTPPDGSFSAQPDPFRDLQTNGSEVRKLQPPLRILVVDDLVDAAESMAMLLRALGHEARTAYDGSAALTAAAAMQPHIILLDIALPQLDGYHVAQQLRQSAHTQSACLVALTGFGCEADIQRSHLAGFDHHLLKPVKLEQLNLVIRQVIDNLQRRLGD
jgi:two-component system, OmpR family, response regulator